MHDMPNLLYMFWSCHIYSISRESHKSIIAQLRDHYHISVCKNYSCESEFNSLKICLFHVNSMLYTCKVVFVSYQLTIYTLSH